MTSLRHMNRLVAVCLCGLLTTVLTHCGQSVALQKQLVEKFTPEAPDKFAREFIEAIRSGRITDAVQQLDSSLQTNDGMKGMEQLSLLFKGGEVESLEVIGVNTFYQPSNESSVNLVYQMHLSTGWFTGNVVVSEKGEVRKIISSYFNPSPGPLDQIHAFTWQGKGARHYFFLLLCAANLVLIFIATRLCIKSTVRRKGLWIVFILIGFMTFRLNWTTGAVDTSLASFQLMGVSFFKGSPWSPWVIGVSVPIGALVFLWRRKHLARSVPPALPVP